MATDREREGVRAREIARQASRGVGWGGEVQRAGHLFCALLGGGWGGERGKRGKRGGGGGGIVTRELKVLLRSSLSPSNLHWS